MYRVHEIPISNELPCSTWQNVSPAAQLLHRFYLYLSIYCTPMLETCRYLLIETPNYA